MPNTIPYDPSLTMGNIVHPLRVSILEKIAAAQAPVTAAETNLNSLITLKRSLDATIREMLEMGVDVTALIQEGETVKAQIQKAAIEYGNLKMIAEKGVQLLRSTIRDVHSDVESPLDYNRSEIKNMPLGNNSIAATERPIFLLRNKYGNRHVACRRHFVVCQSCPEFPRHAQRTADVFVRPAADKHATGKPQDRRHTRHQHIMHTSGRQDIRPSQYRRRQSRKSLELYLP